mmetsp:Transcript_49929/g.120957  ORF Transcript_49929/g.120957 Transcript_49929/m.120957 type:complete len:450 (+) Transcript_49929:543-1892(+)
MSEVIYSVPNNNVIGYTCSQLVANNANQLVDFDLIFYMDVASPIGQQGLMVEHIQRTLVPLMGTRYGISSDDGCMSPPIDGTSWILQFTLEQTDFEIIDIFDGCRTLQSSGAVQDCEFYQVTLRGSYIGDGRGSSSSASTASGGAAAAAAAVAVELQDVVNFLELTVDSAALTQGVGDDSSKNSLFVTKFDGVPVYDDASNNAGDAGRDSLNDAVNDGGATDSLVAGQPTTQNNGADRRTITIVGGLLVAAFGLAFFGICFILYRRRQYFLHQRQVHQWENNGGGEDGGGEVVVGDLDLDGNNKDSGLGGDLERYNTSNTEEEEKDDEYANDGMMEQQQQQQQYHQSTSDGITRDDVSSPQRDLESSLDDNLGASLKDQLMGVHGTLGGGSRNSGLNLQAGNGGKLGGFGSLLPSTQSVDGDSDADSWAQTDGTIGSLEIGLEPITAEI